MKLLSFIPSELAIRTRLIGFAGLTGALNSEALYNDSFQFKMQVSIIMRPILANMLQTDITVMDEQFVVLNIPLMSALIHVQVSRYQR